MASSYLMLEENIVSNPFCQPGKPGFVELFEPKLSVSDDKLSTPLIRGFWQCSRCVCGQVVVGSGLVGRVSNVSALRFGHLPPLKPRAKSPWLPLAVTMDAAGAAPWDTLGARAKGPMKTHRVTYFAPRKVVITVGTSRGSRPKSAMYFCSR